MSQGSPTYSFGPQAEGKALLGLRNGQVLVLAAGMVGGLICLYSGSAGAGAGLTMAVVLATIVVGFVPIRGRTAEQWGPIAVRYTLRQLTGRRWYRSAAPTSGVRARVPSDGRCEAETELPPDLADLEMLAVPVGESEIGVIRDRRRDTFTAVLSARVAAFGLLDPAEQNRRLTDYGGVLAAVGREGSPVRRLQWIERTIPSDGDTLASYLQTERSQAVPLSASSVRSYIELIEDATDVTRDHEVLVALQIDGRRGWRTVKRHGGGVAGACEALRAELRAIAANLGRADVFVEGALRPRQYAAAVRHAFDPYGRRARGRLVKLDPTREGADPRLMGPTGAVESWDDYRTDSAVHRTYWIAGWPAVEVGADFLAPLLMQSDVLRTVSVTMEAIPAGRALRQAEAETTKEDADVETRARKGFRLTARARRRQGAAADREAELAAGHAQLRFAGFVTATAPDAEQLQTTCDDIAHAAQQARLELEPMYGEQAAGFTFSLPLGRGLR
jgi:hypothetical protein